MLSLSRSTPFICVSADVHLREGSLTLVSGGIIIFPALQELEELLRATFLEKAHQRALDGLHFSRGNFRDFAVTVDEAARDLLELKIAGNFSVNKNFG
jgi:hypothetical protein